MAVDKKVCIPCSNKAAKIFQSAGREEAERVLENCEGVQNQLREPCSLWYATLEAQYLKDTGKEPPESAELFKVSRWKPWHYVAIGASAATIIISVLWAVYHA